MRKMKSSYLLEIFVKWKGMVRLGVALLGGRRRVGKEIKIESLGISDFLVTFFCILRFE